MSLQSGQAVLEFTIVAPMVLLTATLTLEAVRFAAFKVALEAVAHEVAAEEAALETARAHESDLTLRTESETRRLEDRLEATLGRLPFRATIPQEVGFQRKRIFTLLKVHHSPTGARGKEPPGVRVELKACLPLLVATLRDFDSLPHSLARDSFPSRDCFGEFRTLGASRPWSYFVVRTEAFAPRHASTELLRHGLAVPEKAPGLTPAVPDLLVGQEKLHDNALTRLTDSLERSDTVRRALAEALHETR